MLLARGYDISAFAAPDAVPSSPQTMFVAERSADAPAALQFMGSTRITCRFILDTKAKSSEVNSVLRSLRLGGFTHGIAVFQSLTAGGSRAALADLDLRLELFAVGEVVMNVMDSNLYIPHVPLVYGSAEDVELRTYATKLPILRRSDSIARRLGLLPNQIVRVERARLEHSQLDAYRIVR